MCVGPTGGGKTTIYEVLKDALESLHRDGHKYYYYQPVHTYVLNPKVRIWDLFFVHTFVLKLKNESFYILFKLNILCSIAVEVGYNNWYLFVHSVCLFSLFPLVFT